MHVAVWLVTKIATAPGVLHASARRWCMQGGEPVLLGTAHARSRPFCCLSALLHPAPPPSPKAAQRQAATQLLYRPARPQCKDRLCAVCGPTLDTCQRCLAIPPGKDPERDTDFGPVAMDRQSRRGRGEKGSRKGSSNGL